MRRQDLSESVKTSHRCLHPVLQDRHKPISIETGLAASVSGSWSSMCRQYWFPHRGSVTVHIIIQCVTNSVAVHVIGCHWHLEGAIDTEFPRCQGSRHYRHHHQQLPPSPSHPGRRRHRCLPAVLSSGVNRASVTYAVNCTRTITESSPSVSGLANRYHWLLHQHRCSISVIIQILD